MTVGPSQLPNLLHVQLNLDCPSSFAPDTGTGRLEVFSSPEGTNVNSRGLSVAIASEAHGSKKRSSSNPERVEPWSMSVTVLGSTPSGWGLSTDRLPRVALACARPWAIHIGPLRGPKNLAAVPQVHTHLRVASDNPS
jgi:hypothetical protein